MKQQRLNAIRLFLLFLFVGYYASISLFTHTHIVNGVKIVHSHPYKSSSDDKKAGHEHTTHELILIQQLSHFVSVLLVTGLLISGLQFFLKELRYPFKDTVVISNSHFNFLLRAPPFSVHF